MFTLDAEPRSQRYNLKDKKNESEIKKKLQESIAKGKRYKNVDLHEKIQNCTANEEDATKVIQEFEEIIEKKKSDIV